MCIAILGWGSLINEPRGLPIAGEWQKDGPMLWIEFSRISKCGVRAGCLTLVIDERSDEEIQALYVVSARTDLSQAIADLQTREGMSPDDIGFCEVASGRFAPSALNRHPKSCERIHAWALKKRFDSVIWTALPRRFQDAIGVPFSPAAALKYLNSLSAPTKENALRYIHSAPEQTMTPFRRLLLESEDNFEWTSPLTAEENNALHGYKDNTWEFINRSIRSGNLPADLQEQVALLDLAIQKGRSTKAVTLFRATGRNFVTVEGDVIKPSQAFLSTSMLDDCLGQFFDTDSPVKIIIECPPYTAMAAFEHDDAGGEEHERLLPRGTRFRIKSHKTVPNSQNPYEPDGPLNRCYPQLSRQISILIYTVEPLSN
jgi:hypothetical protein